MSRAVAPSALAGAYSITSFSSTIYAISFTPTRCSNPSLKRTASQPLSSNVSLLRVHLPIAQAMCPSVAVTHSQVLPLVCGRSAGLRLLRSGSLGSCLVTGRRLWSHLAHAVSLGGCFVFHPAGSNPAVKLTRQRRAAYFVR